MDLVRAINYLYPDASPLSDFTVRDDSDGNGPYIDPAAWKLDAPIPTQAELEAAWEAYQEAEALKPPAPPSDAERIAQLEASREALQQENVTLMLALTEIYEQLLTLQGGE